MSKESMEQQLNKILDAEEAGKASLMNQAQKAKTEHESFLAEFAAKVASVIKPTMQEAGEILTRRGHAFRIAEKGESKDDQGRISGAEVVLTVSPDTVAPTAHRPEHCPHIGFITAGNAVWIHESTMMPDRGGHSGDAGKKYRLAEITKELVEQHIVKVLSESLH